MREKPFITRDAKLHIKDCDLSGYNISMQTYRNDADMSGSLVIENCSNINTVYFYEADGYDKCWKGHVIIVT